MGGESIRIASALCRNPGRDQSVSDATFWNGRWWSLRGIDVPESYTDYDHRPRGKALIIAHSSAAATPMDPNGWRFSHPYYNDWSLPFEILTARWQARGRALDRALSEQSEHARQCSAPPWHSRSALDTDDESIQSVQSERDDADEVEGKQDDHLDRYQSRTRFHQEADNGAALTDAEELERSSAKCNRVVKGRKKQPKRHASGREVAEEAFLRSGNLRPKNIFDQEPVEFDEDDVFNTSRLSFDRPTFSTEEEEPVAETPTARGDNRWRPEHCVIAAKWTDPPRKKPADPRKKIKPFLKPAEERGLFEALQSGRNSHEYNRAWTKVIEAYRHLIESRVRYHCKSWPNIIPEEVIAYTVSKIFEHKKIDKFNPNRGKLATLLRTIVKNCFVDYTREVMAPSGLVGKGIKDNGNSIRVQSFDAVDDNGVEFGELLDDSSYGLGIFPDWEAPTLPDDLLTAQERQVYQRYYFEEKSVEEIAKEISLSTQRVYQLKSKAKSKIEDYYAISITSKEKPGGVGSA